MPVGELLARTSSRELTEWIAYERVAGPVGPERDDQLAALVASTTANAMRAKGRAKKIGDFVPKWSRPSQEGPQQIQLAAALAARVGGEFVKGGGFDPADDSGQGQGAGGGDDR